MPAKKQISKSMILEAALRMLRQRGMDGINVKDLAKSLNCSTQPIYLSFDGMDQLRQEVSGEAKRIFLEYLKQGIDQLENHLYGMRYIHFAKEESELFKFLFMRSNAYEEMKGELKPVMEQSIRHLMEQYLISYEEAHRFHDHLWVHTHGIASMIATKYCDWDMDTIETMLNECKTYLGMKYHT